MLPKEIISAKQAVEKIRSGHSVMVGGFIGCGVPNEILAALAESEKDNLTLISNDTGTYSPDNGNADGVAGAILAKKFSTVIASHIGTNRETGRQMNANEINVQLVPQGTLAERIRSAGHGIGGFLTPTGLGTEIENDKQVIVVKGKKYLLEEPLFADVALIRAEAADKAGNLVYRKAARNFNPLMAAAAGLVIAEVEKIVEIGEIDPEHVITPGIFVNYLVLTR